MNLPVYLDQLTFHLASSPNVFTYFGQSNFAGKIVILILVVCSIVAWSVMLGKYMDLSRLRSQNQRYERLLSKESHLLALEPSRPGKGSGPYYNIVREGLEAFFRYGGALDDADVHRATLRMGHVENALQRGVAEQTIRYEAKMVLLGSIVTGAPFLGLLGTVWGVMDAFGSMAGSGSASCKAWRPVCIRCLADHGGGPGGGDSLRVWLQLSPATNQDLGGGVGKLCQHGGRPH